MKVLVIGQFGVGKSTLTHALARALDLPCHRIDDYRCWLGDGSISADYQASAGFLNACAQSAHGIFEFTATGVHRAAVRLAMIEHGAPLVVINVWCLEETRAQRLQSRPMRTPFPSWNVDLFMGAHLQLNTLRDDVNTGYWTSAIEGSVRFDFDGSGELEAELEKLLHIWRGINTERVLAHGEMTTWTSKALGVAPRALSEQDTRPVGLRGQPCSNFAWEIESPEVTRAMVNQLCRVLEEKAWTTWVGCHSERHTLVTSLSPDHSTHLALRLALSPPEDLPTWEASFLQRLERASAYRAASDAHSWHQHATSSLDALERWWCMARGHEEVGRIREHLPPDLRKMYRDVAPSLDLANSASEAQRLLDFAEAMARDVMRHADHGHTSAERMCDGVLLLQRLCDGRDALWNFRDVASVVHNRVRPGWLFRGSSPTRYFNDPRYADSEFFERWLSVTRVRSVIDLRTDLEVEKSPYSEYWNIRLPRLHVPMAGKVVPGLLESEDHMTQSYLSFLEAHHDELRAIIAHLCEQEGPVLIHCHAGRDRTGVVIAMLLYLIGVPRELITRDYLTSGSTSNVVWMNAVLDHMEAHGDARSLARHLCIGVEELARLKETLTP